MPMKYRGNSLLPCPRWFVEDVLDFSEEVEQVACGLGCCRLEAFVRDDKVPVLLRRGSSLLALGLGSPVIAELLVAALLFIGSLLGVLSALGRRERGAPALVSAR